MDFSFKQIQIIDLIVYLNDLKKLLSAAVSSGGRSQQKELEQSNSFRHWFLFQDLPSVVELQKAGIKYLNNEFRE